MKAEGPGALYTQAKPQHVTLAFRRSKAMHSCLV